MWPLLQLKISKNILVSKNTIILEKKKQNLGEPSAQEVKLSGKKRTQNTYKLNVYDS